MQKIKYITKLKNEWELKSLCLKKHKPKIKPFLILERSEIKEIICHGMFLRAENENFDISLVLDARQSIS